MNTKNRKRTLFICGTIAVIFVLALFGYSQYSQYQEELNAQESAHSAPLGWPRYILNLYASSEDLFLLRRKTLETSALYFLDADNEQRYIRDFPAGILHWNNDTATFRYLSGAELCEFDPVTQQLSTQPLNDTYQKIRAVTGSYIFLQPKQGGTVFMTSADSSQTTALNVSGSILTAYDEYLFTWKSDTKTLSCYRFPMNELIWALDLEKYFPFGSSAPILCPVGEDLYLASSSNYGLYLMEDFPNAAKAESVEFVYRVLAMTPSKDSVILASPTIVGIDFYRVRPKETPELLTSWSTPGSKHYYDWGISLEEVGGKLYCAADTINELFVFDLNSGNSPQQ